MYNLYYCNHTYKWNFQFLCNTLFLFNKKIGFHNEPNCHKVMSSPPTAWKTGVRAPDVEVEMV